MTASQCRVEFQPAGRTVYVLAGSKVFEAAGRAGLVLQTPCGGAGTCGRCRVQFTAGAPDPCPNGLAKLSDEQIAAGWRLACQATIQQDCAVYVPPGALLGPGQRVLTDAVQTAADIAPAVRKIHVQLNEPRMGDAQADLLRLQAFTGPCRAGLPVLRTLSRRLRAQGFAGTAVLADGELIDLEPGDTTGRCFGAAIDVGTTTLAAVLVDLTDGSERAVASAVNPQVRFGDDVLSRIHHAGQFEDGIAQLQSCVLEAAEDLLSRLCETAHVARPEVYQVVLAGNTTMQHLLCGLDVEPLGRVPFAPVTSAGLAVPAHQLKLGIHPRGRAALLPVIGGFVGGDTVAGMLATELDAAEGATLMIDIGTNGEIVLAANGELLAASAAAGPAFEGARISCGMRAAPGAIEKVLVDGDVQLGVIGDLAPAGLCGSGLVDLVAGLLDAGIITPEGRLLPANEAPQSLAQPLRDRLTGGPDGQPAVLLAGRGDRAIHLTQRDVRELQLAAGAIRAGVTLLLKQAGLTGEDLQRVLIAGGFGSFIRRNHAQRIGLLPAGVPHERIHYVGNASLAGARWVLLSARARERAEQIARGTRHVELSQDPAFQMEFAEAMIFPS